MHLHQALPHQFRQAVEAKWPLLVPTGCIEYHGPHLPLGVDTLITLELLDRVNRVADCVIAPPLWYGPASYAVTGPELGSLDVNTERFGRHVKDVLAGFWDMGFHWIIVAVHHQGLEGPESLAIRQAAVEVTFERSYVERGKAWWGKAALGDADNVFERIQVWPSVLPSAGRLVSMADHAGFYETSLMLAAHPGATDLGRLDADAPWYTQAPAGSATKASAASGEDMWAVMVDAWRQRLEMLNPFVESSASHTV